MIPTIMILTIIFLLIIMIVMNGAALVYQDGMTALMHSSGLGHKDTAIALAEKGADLNAQDDVSD